MPLLQPETNTRPSRRLAWTLFILVLSPVGVFITMALLALLGKCDGALGSGVVCERFDFSTVLMGAEVGIIIMGGLLLPVIVASIVVGIRGLLKRKEEGVYAPALRKDPYFYLVIVIVCYFSLSLLGSVLTSISNLLYSKYGPPRSQKIVTEETNLAQGAAPQEQTQPKILFRITSPNGGDQIKIGYPYSIMWDAEALPREAQLDVELFEITGDTIQFGENGACLNCVGGGLRSGVSAVSPVFNGYGNAQWAAPGVTYAGSRLKPGNHYVLKATVSKTGTYERGECAAPFATCVIDIATDWSDRPFSLVN